MTRLAVLLAVLAVACAGAEVFRRVATGQTDDAFTVFVLIALIVAFSMLAVLFRRIGRLETALKHTHSAPKDH